MPRQDTAVSSTFDVGVTGSKYRGVSSPSVSGSSIRKGSAAYHYVGPASAGHSANLMSVCLRPRTYANFPDSDQLCHNLRRSRRGLCLPQARMLKRLWGLPNYYSIPCRGTTECNGEVSILAARKSTFEGFPAP